TNADLILRSGARARRQDQGPAFLGIALLEPTLVISDQCIAHKTAMFFLRPMNSDSSFKYRNLTSAYCGTKGLCLWCGISAAARARSVHAEGFTKTAS